MLSLSRFFSWRQVSLHPASDDRTPGNFDFYSIGSSPFLFSY